MIAKTWNHFKTYEYIQRDVYLIRDVYLMDVYLVYNIPMRIVDNLALLIVYTYMFYSISIEP